MSAPASSKQLHRLQHAVFGAVAAARHARAVLDAGGGHQRRDAFLARQIDERAVLEQQFDERRIAGARGAQQRRRALREDGVAAAILRHVAVRRTPLELNVRVGALLEQHPRDVERGQRVFAREDRHRAVALHRQRADVRRHVERRAPVEVPLVDVGSRFDQFCGDVEVEVEQRHVQRRHAIRIFEVEVGTAGDEVLRALDAAFTRGIQQRRKAAMVHVLRARLGDDLALPLVDDAARVDVRPASTSNLTISAWLCAGAHISADCPPKAFLRVDVRACLDEAPWPRRSCRCAPPPSAASRLPGSCVFGSAPALISASMTGAEPMIAASVIADVPN